MSTKRVDLRVIFESFKSEGTLQVTDQVTGVTIELASRVAAVEVAAQVDRESA